MNSIGRSLQQLPLHVIVEPSVPFLPRIPRFSASAVKQCFFNRFGKWLKGLLGTSLKNLELFTSPENWRSTSFDGGFVFTLPKLIVLDLQRRQFRFQTLGFGQVSVAFICDFL